MKKSVSLFLDQMSSALNPLPDDEDEESLMIVGSDTVTLSRLQVIHSFCIIFYVLDLKIPNTMFNFV